MNEDPKRRYVSPSERMTSHIPDTLSPESARTEAEESLVSIGVQFPESIESMAATVTADDFIDPILSKIWQLICDTKDSGNGVNRAEILSECFKRGYIQEIGGKAAFLKVIDRQVSYQNAKYYATKVARLAELRTIEFAVGHVRELLKDPDADPLQILHAFQSRTEGVGKSKDAGFCRMSDIIDEIVTEQELPEDERVSPISTGIPTLDSVIDGFSPGKLYLLGGRTRKGKSALAGNFALAAVDQGKSVWFVSMEMPKKDLAQRTLAYALQMNLSRFKTKLTRGEIEAIKTWNDGQREAQNWVTETCNESIKSIRAKVKLRKSLDGLDLLIVDNLQLMRAESSEENHERQLKRLTESLKAMAKELDIAIVLLCQLNAKAENERANLVSWAGCTSIPNDADATMILTTSETTVGDVRESILSIHKVRDGVGNIDIDLDFIGKYQEFAERLPK